MKTADLTTPALIVDGPGLEANLRVMSEALPGPRLRPHVKAHKCTALARRQAALGHPGFTCATITEMEGMAQAGLGDDLLLANEVADAPDSVSSPERAPGSRWPWTQRRPSRLRYVPACRRCSST